MHLRKRPSSQRWLNLPCRQAFCLAFLLLANTFLPLAALAQSTDPSPDPIGSTGSTSKAGLARAADSGSAGMLKTRYASSAQGVSTSQMPPLAPRIGRPGQSQSGSNEDTESNRIARPGAQNDQTRIARPGSDSNSDTRISRPVDGSRKSETAKSETPREEAKSETTKTDFAKSETPRETAKSQPAKTAPKSEPAKPAASKAPIPLIAKPAGSLKPETAKTDTSKPGSTKPASTKPGTASGTTSQLKNKANDILNGSPARPPETAPPRSTRLYGVEEKDTRQAESKPLQAKPSTTDAKPSTTEPAKTAGADTYPVIGKLEEITFGKPTPEVDIETRLSKLENAIFAKSYPHDSLFDRSERLQNALMGTGGPGASPTPPGTTPTDPPPPASGWTDSSITTGQNPDPADLLYLDDLAKQPDMQESAPKAVLENFALELINYERQRRGIGQLELSPLANKLATEHMKDLVQRDVVSHSSEKGENPDRRYTILGGVDAINESLNVINTSELGSSRLTKAAIAKILKQMLTRQDDREAILAPEASHLGFAMEQLASGSKIVTCTEVMTSRGVMHPLPQHVHLGEKIDVSGIVLKPYQFDRITVAWEGTPEQTAPVEESDDPLPYFPPLDFVAYKEKSEKDYSKAIVALKAVGLLAAIAGGMFIPPVALAAPLIVMAGPDPGEPKPQSDIPIRGGVKVSGSTFSGKVVINNDSKEGLYYVTVWATLGEGARPFAISRRTIEVKSGGGENSHSASSDAGSSANHASTAASDTTKSKTDAASNPPASGSNPTEDKASTAVKENAAGDLLMAPADKAVELEAKPAEKVSSEVEEKPKEKTDEKLKDKIETKTTDKIETKATEEKTDADKKPADAKPTEKAANDVSSTIKAEPSSPGATDILTKPNNDNPSASKQEPSSIEYTKGDGKDGGRNAGSQSSKDETADNARAHAGNLSTPQNTEARDD